MRIQILSIVVLITGTLPLSATTWIESKVIDPISGKEVSVHEIASYGGYIYHWPSKYDAIYWPYTAEEHIRFSSESGYAAFGEDFVEINESSKERVKEYLKKNYDKKTSPKTHQEKLEWLKKVYEVRGVDEAFWLKYYCLQAYLHARDDQKSTEFRKKAIEIAAKYVTTLKPGYSLLQTYFILGSYNQMLGQKEAADEFFKKMKSVTWKAEKGKMTSEDAIKYFSELAVNLQSGKYLEEYIPKLKKE